MVELNIEIYNCFFHYCETLGSTPVHDFQQNNNESWINNNLSEGKSQISRVKQDKCPINALKNFRKDETVNVIRFKQTAKIDTFDPIQNDRTTETIKRTEKDFSLDLPLLLDETARDVKSLNAKSAIEKIQLESVFYPDRPHRLQLSTRFGLIFFNDKIVSPENMRTTIIAMMHQGHTSVAKIDQLVDAFWWPGLFREIGEKTETCPSCRATGKNFKTQIPSTEKLTRNLSRTESKNLIGFRRSNQIKDTRRRYSLVANDLFSK